MSTGILLLSPELQLRIIDFILEQPEEYGGKEEEDKGDEQIDSTEHLVSSNLKTLINLSATCHTFRALVAPFVYKKLYLTNTETSAASVKAVADGPFRDIVTELLFVGRANGLEEAGADDSENLFPEELELVLTNLGKDFPRLKSLNVGFAYELSEYDVWETWAQDTFYEVETVEEVLEQEKKHGFLALISQIWTAIASNVPVKHLKMRHFIPKLSPVYTSELFHSFLSGVDRFEMSIWGADNGVGWESNVGEGYTDALSRLECIFSALTACTDFTVEASRYGWYGLQGYRHAPHPFHVGQMPLLRRLTLRHCFISPDLRILFEDHKDTLEEITLRDCAASINTGSGTAENGIEWRALFDAMLCMKVLQKIEVLPFLKPDTSEESSVQDTSSQREEGENKHRDQPTSLGECRRIFAYGTSKSITF